MDNTDNMVNLGIDKGLIENVLEKKVQAAIIANIGDPGELIAKTVEAVLKRKVDYSGEISKYKSDNRFDLLELIATKKIQEMASEVIKEWAVEYSERIKQEIKLQLERPATTRKLVKNIVESCQESVTRFNFSASIQFTEIDDR